MLHVVPFEPMSEALRAFAAAEHVPLEEEEARYRHARTLGDHLTGTAEARVRDKGLTDVRLDSSIVAMVVAAVKRDLGGLDDVRHVAAPGHG